MPPHHAQRSQVPHTGSTRQALLLLPHPPPPLPRRAGLSLYGIQIASQNVERNPLIIPITTVESITHTDTGDELGPPERICDTPEDCATCAERDTCQDDDKAKD